MAATVQQVALEVVFSAEREVSAFLEQVEGELLGFGYSDRERGHVRHALQEALINALKHGNGLDPKKKVRFLRRITPEDMQFQIIDEGPGFNPDDVPDPTLVENLERPCGRGLFMMRCFMDEVTF